MPAPAIGFCGHPDALWTYRRTVDAVAVAIAPPVMRIDGQDTVLAASTLGSTEANAPVVLPNGIIEHRWCAPVDLHPHLELTLIARLAADCPVVRFRYEVRSDTSSRLCGNDHGSNALRYMRVDLAGHHSRTEIRLGSFIKTFHSFTLEENPVTDADFSAETALMGPILAATNEVESLLLAYEHGSQTGSRYLQYQLHNDGGVSLAAVKGNYHHGQIISREAPFQSIWFQIGVVAGGMDALAGTYRHFVLNRLAANPASRTPFIYYNTWNHQERLKHLQGRTYLAEMNESRMLAEIDTAHRLGVEVFVIDTGWYSRTGDWEVDLTRFPDRLASVRRALEERGMRLGLWFNPTIAALTSAMHATHRDCIQEWRGVPHPPHAHWEGEPSQGLCVVSRYADAYADTLVRLVRELGVTYFKWDAISQEGEYSCDAAGHHHGHDGHSAEERADCYGFEQVRALIRIVERVQSACPEAIFDFDITEPGRAVGLAFLSVGRFFLINNGPYYSDYDLPNPEDGNANLFFQPGHARTWICRSTLGYDRWIPSVLFLVHYFPDGPSDSRLVNLASMLLGHNGVWGDLQALGTEEISEFRRVIDCYRQVRDAVNAAAPVRSGLIGGEAEVHEKITAGGRGMVAMLSTRPGRFEYATRNAVAADLEFTTFGDLIVKRLDCGRTHLKVSFHSAGAAIVFFGAVRPSPS